MTAKQDTYNKWYAKNKEKIKEQRKVRYQKDLEKARLSGKIRSKKFRDLNPEKNTQAVRKYRTGWSKEDVKKQLLRQNNSCGGCLVKITEKAHLDHDHVTGKVRGLLCPTCNLALGLVKDKPETLRRLMSYLDHDLDNTLVYLIGALKNERIPDVGILLRNAGYDVMDEWFTPGALADENWQKYENRRGRTYIEALRGRAATNIFLFDRSYLDQSDIVVLVMPAGKSAMLELGYAKGRGKKTAIFLDGTEPDRYDIMPAFADKIFKTEDELLQGIKTWTS